MKIQEGYLYHIKDEFFDLINDETLMQNHERGRTRPTYFVIKEKDFLWFIPLSSKVDKYKKIIDKKIERYGKCNTIMICNIMGIEHAILLQNAFPTLEKYISHIHKVNGIPVKVISNLKKEIEFNFTEMLTLKEKGINLFFTDVDKMKKILLNELKK